MIRNHQFYFRAISLIFLQNFYLLKDKTNQIICELQLRERKAKFSNSVQASYSIYQEQQL